MRRPPPVVASAEDDEGRRIQAALGATLGGLDGLRGLAIAGVLCAHFLNAWPGQAPLDRAVIATLGLGWAGVDLFFVLSGLLITGILVDTLGRDGWWTSFLARRALRIFPLYYLVLAMFGLLGPPLGLVDPWTFGRWGWWYAAYLGNWAFAARQVIPPLSHFWSLGVEEQFYLAWPGVVWLLRGRRLALASLLLVVAGPALRSILVYATDWPPGSAFRVTPGRLDELALGALLATLLRTPAGRAWLRQPRVVGAAMSLGALGFIWLGLANHGFDMHRPALQIWSHTLLGLAFGGLVTRTVCTAGTGARVQRILGALPLRLLGRYSYGIYVLHYLVHLWALRTLRAWPPGAALLSSRVGYAGYAIAGAAASVALAAVSWHLLEQRCLALKRYFVPRPMATTPAD
jgi:peptidoglycan/LPS O-acetylase OafA/YrhL